MVGFLPRSHTCPNAIYLAIANIVFRVKRSDNATSGRPKKPMHRYATCKPFIAGYPPPGPLPSRHGPRTLRNNRIARSTGQHPGPIADLLSRSCAFSSPWQHSLTHVFSLLAWIVNSSLPDPFRVVVAPL